MTEEGSDDDLVALAGRGDSRAFTKLVARHHRRLTAMTARIVGPSRAEDIVQETLTRAWTHAPAWRSRSGEAADGMPRPSYAAWLSRVALNLARDQARRPPAMPMEAAPELPDPGCDAETALIRDERRERLRGAIARLPDRQRVALSLSYDADLSNAEAASAMETSVGAFELLLVRARRSLRAALAEEPDR